MKTRTRRVGTEVAESLDVRSDYNSQGLLARAPTQDTMPSEIWLPRSASTCYEIFCDVERMPEWMGILRSVAIHSCYRDGRARNVGFLATLRRASVGYTLIYTYRECDLRVAWCPIAGAGMSAGGWAQFHPVSVDSCVLVCDLWLDPGGALSGWDDPIFDAHAALATVVKFRDFVTKTTRALSQEVTMRQPRPA